MNEIHAELQALADRIRTATTIEELQAIATAPPENLCPLAAAEPTGSPAREALGVVLRSVGYHARRLAQAMLTKEGQRA